MVKGLFFIGITLLVPACGLLERDDVVGDQHGKSTSCQLKEIRALPNGTGSVAVLRYANCPGPMEQGNEYYVVFVKPIGGVYNSQNLVLQYEPGYVGNREAPPPKLEWQTPSLLRITNTGSMLVA
jgi:hypothetical protein